MTTVSQIITDAYQYNNIVALSVIPTAAEQAKALRYLNRIFRNVFGNEIGEKLQVYNIGSLNVSNKDNDFYLEAPYYVPHNSRLVLSLNQPITVYLPQVPNDGERFAVQDVAQNLSNYPFTVSANGRRIETLTSLVLNSDGTNSQWFFREDLGNWVRLNDLSLSDEFPLPSEFEEFFITMLALRLGASEDVDLNNQLSFVLKDVGRKLRARYKQKIEMPSELGLVRTPSNFYNQTQKWG